MRGTRLIVVVMFMNREEEYIIERYNMSETDSAPKTKTTAEKSCRNTEPTRGDVDQDSCS